MPSHHVEKTTLPPLILCRDVTWISNCLFAGNDLFIIIVFEKY